jgi:hypothetical protein
MRLALIAAAFITAYGFLTTSEYFRFGDRAVDDTIAGLPAYEEAWAQRA